MLEWLFGSKPTETMEEKRYSPERLRERAKLLREVDNSWRAKLGTCLKCLGMEDARKHAGFSYNEIKAIQQQISADRREQRALRKLQLEDPSYLRKRYNEREDIDISWTAFFCGTIYARRKAGFESDEDIAIDKWRDQEFSMFSSITGLFSSKKPQEQKPPIPREKSKEIEQKQIERRKSLR